MKKLFLCTCNGTLNKLLDFTRIGKEAKAIYDVVEVADNLCLEEGLAELEKGLSGDDRLVIGACSSQIIGVPMKQRIKNDLVAFVPLREQVGWVHLEEGESATNKAIVLLSDAAVQLDYMESQAEFTENMVGRVLVIGGGIAGLKAASDLHRLGVEVTLLEPFKLDKHHYLQTSVFMSDADTLRSEIQEIQKTILDVERIRGEIREVRGQLGSYEVTINGAKDGSMTQEFGAIIIASGNQQSLPSSAKKMRYGKSERVVTLDSLISNSKKKRAKDRSTILVAVDFDAPMSSVEGSHLLRTTRDLAARGNTIIVVYSDIQTEDENLYREARDSGVIFIRGRVTRIKENDKGLSCRIENTLESMQRDVIADRVAIPRLIGPTIETTQIAEKLGVECDDSGFIRTRYSKMKPVQTSRRGIFVAGGAKMPMSLSDAMASAQNAVLEAFKIVRSPLVRSGWIPVIDDEECDVCKACLDACPNDALRLMDGRIVHIPAHCEFCGICVSACPTRAIEFQSHSKESWFARFEAIAATHKRLEGKKPFSLVFACSECANASIDQAGFVGKQYGTGSYVIQFPCAGMVSPIEILKGLVVGANRVIVAHCPSGGCHHQTGDHLSELVVSLTRDMLREIGQNPDRVRATYMMAAMPDKMQKEVPVRG